MRRRHEVLQLAPVLVLRQSDVAGMRRAQDVQVYCRKRPINHKELANKEFDVLSVLPGGRRHWYTLLLP